jgi:hypothetical protein
MTKVFNSLLAVQMDPFNVACDLAFVNVWSIVGEGIGIPSFFFLKILFVINRYLFIVFNIYLFLGT